MMASALDVLVVAVGLVVYVALLAAGTFAHEVREAIGR